MIPRSLSPKDEAAVVCECHHHNSHLETEIESWKSSRISLSCIDCLLNLRCTSGSMLVPSLIALSFDYSITIRLHLTTITCERCWHQGCIAYLQNSDMSHI